jgi:monoamine oxidase
VLRAPEGAPGAVRVHPDPGKRDALARLEMGSVVKVVLRFRTPLWERSPGLAEALRSGEREVKFLLDDGAFPTWWTASPLLAPVLVAWAGGSRAQQLSRAAADPTAAAVAALARLLGRSTAEVASQMESSHWHDWESDPFTRGAYSYGAPGAGDASERLAAPVAGTLFYAGEATAGAGRTATVDAALETGHRAAAEIVRALGRG